MSNKDFSCFMLCLYLGYLIYLVLIVSESLTVSCEFLNSKDTNLSSTS